ncbi:DUF3991 and toprim domain-containing protein [Notoacmeibacter sp. MSK16QG-6]|uniref:DUF3991 and toprim domain-containing protein n=1 Tax=Notoacmeibacter sp. MSK16QG-6 TaxID=2957982 RepID=UPI0020A13D40|nr:DUF3991 and toprim domain-containing protein [Notoacmeibacter sp. MSK16QG-6]MCP1200982.1 DUF3991 and toprim domain-containing protein [Notoacmeibacter sp. MSK16QG-6]
MEKADLEELRGKVACGAVLETAGFAVDPKESTRRAVKYRRGDDIIIVIHDGKGWFDPLSEAKGDVFRLVEHLDGLPFAAALYVVADLVGFVPSEPEWKRQSRERAPDLAIPERWNARRKPWRGSATWRYLRDERDIPEAILRSAVTQDILREGPQGSMWAAHRDRTGAVTGWEERGPDWRGFATGGAKVLFRFGPVDGPRLCVAEAAIDAMSLAALEEQRPDTRYLSTGGGWSPASSEALLDLAVRADALLVAATDNNAQGETFAERLEALAADAGCGFVRLRPELEDWNEDLKAKRRKKDGREEERDGCRMPAVRLKGEAPPG